LIGFITENAPEQSVADIIFYETVTMEKMNSLSLYRGVYMAGVNRDTYFVG
jgi:hypothetical protein